MRTQNEVRGDLAIVTVSEPRLDGSRGGELKHCVVEVIGKGHRWILVDLSAVGFIDSTGLSAIVSSLKLLGKHGDLTLCGLTPAVQNLFELTRMTKVFRIFTTRSDAVAALSTRAHAASQ